MPTPDLINEAESAEMEGWGFDVLEGRATRAAPRTPPAAVEGLVLPDLKRSWNRAAPDTFSPAPHAVSAGAPRVFGNVPVVVPGGVACDAEVVSSRRSWTAVLAGTVVALGVQEVLALRAVSAGGTRQERLVAGAGWALWAAVPYVVALVTMIVARRVRSARRLSLVAALVVSAIGIGFAVAASADRSGDPLVGLVWILAPLAQLAAAIGIGVGVIVDVRDGRQRTVPDLRV